jgi:hypothetical protein
VQRLPFGRRAGAFTLAALAALSSLRVMFASQAPAPQGTIPVGNAMQLSALNDYAGLLDEARQSAPLTQQPTAVFVDEHPVDTKWEAWSPERKVTNAVCRADSVIVTTLAEGQVFADADLAFLFTDFAIHVDEGIRNTRAGDTVHFVRPGGKFFGATGQVLAHSTTFPDLVPHARYLLLMYRGPSGVFTVFHPFDAFLLTDGLARTIDPGVHSPDFRQGLPDADVLGWARTANCGK